MKKNILSILIILIILISVTFVANFSCSQNGKNAQNNNLSQDVSLDDILQDDEKVMAQMAFDVTKCLPKGYVVDASVDYTDSIRKCLNKNKIVMMPSFPLLISEKGLNVSSGARIFFQDGSSLIMKANSLSNYAVLLVSNVNDVVIYSPVIVGDRDKHLGTSGEWGMGISIKDSKNVCVKSPSISNCWGDGIYIGKTTGNSTNIEILDGKIDNCRRNGISICDGRNVKIQNTIISNSNGTLPMCGIDIEPNDSIANIDSIKISNVTTLNNSNGGILIALNYILSKKEKKVGIEINNHIDDGSNYGFILYGFNSSSYPYATPLTGSIIVNSPVWKNNKIQPVGTGGVYKMSPQTIFNNIQIINSSKKIEDVKLLLSKINVSVN